MLPLQPQCWHDSDTVVWMPPKSLKDWDVAWSSITQLFEMTLNWIHNYDV